MPDTLRLNTITGTILLVDDDAGFLESVRRMLMMNECTNIMMLNDSRKVMSELERGGISVVLLDWIMPHLSGAELLQRLTQNHPNVPVIIMTAVTDTETIVKCIRQGASDFITKPIDENRLLSCLHKAVQISAYEERVQRLSAYLQGAPLARPELFGEIITCSPKMQSMLKTIESVAPSGSPILVTGETGVGKELVARAIHRASNLAGQFIPVNVASLDDEIFSDTLFGHVKGAYTGASEAREGLIGQAAGGTLFFDEIGDLGREAQVKLLRLLQEQEYYRIGSDKVQKCKARIVAASNCNFDELRAHGRFRHDLYYRLCGYQVHVPALRERPEDIALLARHFAEQEARALDRQPPIVPDSVLQALQRHPYTGNVRELINQIRQALISSNARGLSIEDFPGVSAVSPSSGNLRVIQDTFYRLQGAFERFPSLDELERLAIGEAMHSAEGSKVLAARMLGISRTTLNKKLNEELDS